MKRNKYIYMDRFVFMLNNTLNGWAIWCLRNDTLDHCEATPHNLEMLDLAFPDGYKSYHQGNGSADAARRDLERLAKANNMTVLAKGGEE